MFDTGPRRMPPMMGGGSLAGMNNGMISNPGNLDRGPNFNAKPDLSNFYGESNPMNRINGMSSNVKPPMIQGPSNMMSPMGRINGMGNNNPQIGQANPSQFGNRMGGGMGQPGGNFWQTFMQMLMQNQGQGNQLSHTM